MKRGSIWAPHGLREQGPHRKEAHPTGLLCRKDQRGFKKEHRVLQRSSVKLISFLSIKNCPGLTSRKIKVEKTTADLTVRGWQELLSSSSLLWLSLYLLGKYIPSILSTFIMILYPITLNKLNLQVQRNKVTFTAVGSVDRENNEAAFLTVFVSLIQKSRPPHSLSASERAPELPIVRNKMRVPEQVGLHCDFVHLQDPFEQVEPPHSIEQLSQIHDGQHPSLT